MYVDWGTKIIYVFRADMILIQSTPTTIYQLNINDFRLRLKDLEDEPEGMTFTDTHSHVAPISVGGVDLARVVSVLEPYTVTFEDGQYAVNLVGANSNIGDRVNVNQVSVRSANSAGLPDLDVLQQAAFGGHAHLDQSSSYSGTTYPVGTARYPVNNVPDALGIIQKFNLDGISLGGAMTVLDAGDNVSGLRISGNSAILTQLVINEAAETQNCQILDCYVTGNLDGNTLLERCVVSNLNYVNGFVYRCMLAPGVIMLGGSTTAFFLDCYSGVPGQGTPTIDMNGSGLDDTPFAMRGYSGGIKLIQKTGSAAASIDLSSGQIIIDSTCVNGEIVCRGDGKVVDENYEHLGSGTINGGLSLVNECNYGQHIHDLWVQAGLDPSSPMTIMSDRYQSLRLNVNIQDNGDGSYTLTRQ